MSEALKALAQVGLDDLDDTLGLTISLRVVGSREEELGSAGSKEFTSEAGLMNASVVADDFFRRSLGLYQVLGPGENLGAEGGDA